MKSLENNNTECSSCINSEDINKNDKKEKQKNKKNEKDKEKNHLLIVSYITDENINRCWTFFSDILKCEGNPSNIVINYKLDKGKNTYIIGNEFSCYWIGVSKIHYKCIESKNNYGIKKIAWVIKLDIGFSIRKSYFIYPITNDNRTLIRLNLELIGTENEDPIDFEETREYYYHLQNSIINKIIKVMDESKEYHFIYESFIVEKNQLLCWKTILDINNLSKIACNEIGFNYICNKDPESIGSFWKCELKKEKIIYIRIKNVSKPKKRNTWKYHLETFGTQSGIISQECHIHIIKINENICQITILIEYKEKINKNVYDYKMIKMKKICQKIKEYINNL